MRTLLANEEGNYEERREKMNKTETKITGRWRGRERARQSRTKTNSYTVTFNFHFQRPCFPNRSPCWIQNSCAFHQRGERVRRWEERIAWFTLFSGLLTRCWGGVMNGSNDHMVCYFTWCVFVCVCWCVCMCVGVGVGVCACVSHSPSVLVWRCDQDH